MITQVVLAVIGLVGGSLAFPRTYQEQRQFFYPQPFPAQQQFLNSYRAPTQRLQFQVPAATQLLPNNINTGIRYGQHQLVYVVPAGSQVIFDEQGGQGGTTGPGTEEGSVIPSVVDLWNGVSSYFPTWGGPAEKPAEGGTGGAGSPVKPVEEKPEKIEQKPQKPVEAEKEQLQQQIQQQRYYLFGQPQTYFAPRPAVSSPNQNFLYYKNYQQNEQKPGSAAVAFQRLLQRAGEESNANPDSTTTTTGPTNQEETDSPNDNHPEELGPSIAQAKPQAVSVAGPGGVAAAAPVGTAIVGPGGMALSAPTATAVAGTKPGKPQDKVRSYFPRTSYYPY